MRTHETLMIDLHPNELMEGPKDVGDPSRPLAVVHVSLNNWIIREAIFQT